MIMDAWTIDENNNHIHVTAIFGPDVKLGKNNYIGPYCIIGMPGEVEAVFPAPGKAVGFFNSQVTIGDNNVIAGAVTIDASVNGVTTGIRSNCFIMKQVHIGHDCRIGNNVRIAPHASIGGETDIHDYCNIGMNAAIHQRVVVPEGCMIGIGAVVTKNTYLAQWRKYAGVPAKDIGSNEKFKP